VEESGEKPRGPKSGRGRAGGGGPGKVAAEPSPGVEKDADTRALERLLSEALGMPVDIRLPEDGGDIRIAYGSLESLDDLCRLLQTRQQARGAEPRIRSL
ncbi:MAG: hypothetical protein H7Y08_10600, partial [Rhizobiaceae bacterium]|nr:hypothetical protein [Rhizobiaceae bacterium]